MVWGLKLQPVFNEFFPGGDYIGYKECLDANFEAHANSEEKLGGVTKYRYRVTEKFHCELGIPRPDGPPLSPIKPHEWPTVFKLRKTRARIGSLIKMKDRIYAVDNTLKSIIERLEPGVHQFNPIRILMPKDVEYPVPYHVMVVGRWLDSFRPDESDPGCLRFANGGYSVWLDKKQSYAGIAMAASVIGNAHLWREQNLYGTEFFLSHTLQAEIAKAGLRVPKHFRMKSV